jgi:uncharacterized protein (TIGR02118 family)
MSRQEGLKATWVSRLRIASPSKASLEFNHYDCERRQTMIKVSILMVRRRDLTYEQYIEHWRDIHGPLFASQPASRQYVRRYIQNHITGDALPGTTTSKFDGIAEIWFDDLGGAKAFFASDSYRRNVIPDEEAFMDRKRCELLFTHEHNVMPNAVTSSHMRRGSGRDVKPL